MATVTTSDGVRLRLTDDGPGRPVVLVGGSMGGSTIWAYYDLFGAEQRRGVVTIDHHAAQDWRVVVARVEVPALFVAGRDSQFWPSEHATASAAANDRATAVVLDDCGHAANIDQPDATNAAILEFFS